MLRVGDISEKMGTKKSNRAAVVDTIAFSELSIRPQSWNSDQSIKSLLTAKNPAFLEWESGLERSESLIFQYARRGAPKQITRWLGDSTQAAQQEKLTELVAGFSKLKGFHLFDGLQRWSLDDGSLVPTISEVASELKRRNQDLVLIGVTPKINDHTRIVDGLGVIVDVNERTGVFSTVCDDQNFGLMIQPSVNARSSALDGARRCREQCLRLAGKGWATNLIVYGGELNSRDSKSYSAVEQELLWWAADAKSNPDIKIILIAGSGGVADRYAQNANWLATNPSVKVVAADRQALQNLTATLRPPKVASIKE